MYKFKFRVYKLMPNNEYKVDHDMVVTASDKFEAKQLALNMFGPPEYKIESWGVVTNEVCR